MRDMRIFFDSSALCKYFISEAGTSRVYEMNFTDWGFVGME